MDKQYLKRCVFYVLAVLFSLFMLFYIGYHIYQLLTTSIVTEPTAEVTRTDTLQCDGYIMRSEVVCECSSSGTILPNYSDGSHINVGTELASVYSSADTSTASQIRQLMNQLSMLKSYGKSQTSAKNAVAVDSEIYSLMTKMKSLTQDNDLSGTLQMTTDLLCELNRRSLITGVGGGDFDALISSVEAQISSEKSRLGSVLETVTATRTGWYYADSDGLENIFKPDTIGQMTISDFDSMVSESAQSKTNAGKLVTDFKWYIASKVRKNSVGALEEGDYTDVVFRYNGGETVSMKVERIITELESDECVIVLSAVVMPTGFSYTRLQPVEIVTDSVTGLSVPKGAVRVINGQMGVYTFDGTYSTFVKIKPIREYEDIYIVEANAENEVETDENGEEIKKEESETTGEFSYVDDAPYLRYNDIIITEGKGIYNGKVYS